MAYDIDFKDLATTPIIDIAKWLGLELREASATINGETVIQFVGQCPISKGGNGSAFKITPKINRFVCFCDACKKREKRGGDCIELVCRVRGVERLNAAAQIKTLKGIDQPDDNPPAKQEASQSAQSSGFDPLAYLQTLATAHDALDALLDLSSETFKAFKSGYCSKGLHRGRLAFGLVDSQGEIRGFASAPLNVEGELLFPKDYKVPFYTGLQLVEEGELHLHNNIIRAMEAYEHGMRNMLILLRPITADTLKCLWTLMEQKKCTTLEICY